MNRLVFFTIFALMSSEVSSFSQITTPDLPQICRKLMSGDPRHPKYSSCCDIGNRESVWFNTETRQEERFVFSCYILGVRPASSSLDLDHNEIKSRYIRPVTNEIPPGKYLCSIQSSNSIQISFSKPNIYTTSSGNSGTYRASQPEKDMFGTLVKYKIAGGMLDSFYFMLRDNGDLALGTGSGWGKCTKQ